MDKITKDKIDTTVDKFAKILCKDVCNMFNMNVTANLQHMDKKDQTIAFYLAFLSTCVEVSREMTRNSLYELFLDDGE